MTIRGACVILFAGLSCHGQEPAASLSGIVQDRAGFAIRGALVFLESESDLNRRFQMQTDENGVYRFSELSPDVYRLRFECSGCLTFLVKDVQLSGGEAKSMPPVRLNEASNGCPPYPLTYSKIPLVPFGPRAGNLAGQVVDNDGNPVAAADVSLICGGNRVCTKIRTDSKGEFLFERVAPGKYGLLIGRSFFDPWFARSLEVREDQELTYRPIFLQRCSDKYCDPSLPRSVQITFCQ